MKNIVLEADKTLNFDLFPHGMAHREEGRSAAHHEDGGENEQYVFQLQKHGIGFHHIVAARAKLHETELLLQKHQNDAQ